MKLLRLALLAAALALPAMAMAQWQWIDKSGRKVFSDQGPPADIPASNILRQPGSASGTARTPEAPVAAVTPASAPVPKLSTTDKALEEKRKLSEAEEAAKKKAEGEKVAGERAENCVRLKRAKRQLDSGERIVRFNDKGEKEYLDDNARAAEKTRVDQLMARDCKVG